MFIFLVPSIVMHSFMGQFSSSGFISAFRLSPFFKGKFLARVGTDIKRIILKFDFRHGICERFSDFLNANLL